MINAGGLIAVHYEYRARSAGETYDRDAVMAHVARIAETVESVFQRAAQEAVSTAVAADRIAEQRFGRAPAASQAA